jgi:hypothetical protein
MKVLEKDMRIILPEAELVLPSMARAKKKQERIGKRYGSLPLSLSLCKG